MHILLIDDSSSTRSLLRTLINSGQEVRHEISEAASGEEALQKVGSGEINLPDLIIMDINMGGMSGYELCREFRNQYRTTSDLVPYIIIVTANSGVDVINQALDSGANDYMPKPVNVKVLQVRLRVAERLLSQAQLGAVPIAPTPAAPPSVDVINAAVDAAVATALASAQAKTAAAVAQAQAEAQAKTEAAVAQAYADADARVAAAVAQAHADLDAHTQAAVAAALAQANLGGAPAPSAYNGEGGGDPRLSMIGGAIEMTDAPIALVEVDGEFPSFQIAYANTAMTATTQFDYEQLIGKSLAELEAWTPEFLKMILGYVQRGAILSHAPLWSKTRQSVPVHLSFYPVHGEDGYLRSYLVIHHF